jgi:hypothetical protein
MRPDALSDGIAGDFLASRWQSRPGTHGAADPHSGRPMITSSVSAVGLGATVFADAFAAAALVLPATPPEVAVAPRTASTIPPIEERAGGAMDRAALLAGPQIPAPATVGRFARADPASGTGGRRLRSGVPGQVASVARPHPSPISAIPSRKDPSVLTRGGILWRKKNQ